MTDADLIGYLDRRFGEISQKVDEKVDGLRDELRGEIRQTREELRGEIRQTREGLQGQIGETREGLREEIRQTREGLQGEISETREGLRDEIRQTRVLIEGIHSEVRLVAEAVIGQGETFAVRQMETLKRVEEVMALIGPLYQSLNGRVTVLQERAERETRDVLDVVRERYGRR